MKKEKNLKDAEIFEKICEKQFSIALLKEFFESMGYLIDNYETFNWKKEIFYIKDLKRYLSDTFLAQEIEKAILATPIKKISGSNFLNYLFNYQVDKRLGIFQNSETPLFLINQLDLSKNKFRVVILVNNEKDGFILLILINGFPLILLVILNRFQNSEGPEKDLWCNQISVIFQRYCLYVRLAIMYHMPKTILIPISSGFLPKINKNFLNLESFVLGIMDKLFWNFRREDIVENALSSDDKDFWEVAFRYLPKQNLLMFLQNFLYFSDSYSEINGKWCEVIWQKEICDSINLSIDSLKTHNFISLELNVSENPSLPAIVIQKILNDYLFRDFTIISYIDENNPTSRMRNLISNSHQFFNFRNKGEIEFEREELKKTRRNSIYLTSFNKFMENIHLLNEIDKSTLHVVNLRDLLTLTKDKSIKGNLQKSFKEKNYNSLKAQMIEILNISKLINEEQNKFLVLNFA